MRRLFSLLALTVMLLATSLPALAGQQDFTLVNESGISIVELYVSPASVNSWEEDVLGVETLPSGSSTKVVFSDDEDRSVWDLRLIDENGDEHIWPGLHLKEINAITVDSDFEASAE